MAAKADWATPADVKANAEGHRWFFAQKLREVAPVEWGATGVGTADEEP